MMMSDGLLMVFRNDGGDARGTGSVDGLSMDSLRGGFRCRPLLVCLVRVAVAVWIPWAYPIESTRTQLEAAKCGG